jgi:hypothetical protein
VNFSTRLGLSVKSGRTKKFREELPVMDAADGQFQLPIQEFHADLPDDCPPQDAVPAFGVVYRGLKGLPISEKHFRSHRETGSPCQLEECQCWGLSVWRTRQAVDHARKAVPAIKMHWYIAEGVLAATDGVIKHTPSKTQTEHFTFWRDMKATFFNRFRVIITPDGAGR